jgi:hypothetical protein
MSLAKSDDLRRAGGARAQQQPRLLPGIPVVLSLIWLSVLSLVWLSELFLVGLSVLSLIWLSTRAWVTEV